MKDASFHLPSNITLHPFAIIHGHVWWPSCEVLKQPCNNNLLLLCKITPSRITLWGPRVKSN